MRGRLGTACSACCWPSPRWSACPPPRSPPATAATSRATPTRRRRSTPRSRQPPPPLWRTRASPPCWTARAPLSSRAVPWGGSAGQPAGYRLEYRWGAALAADVDQEWPLLRSDAATPEPPYESTLYRIRASDVTGLQVDVLLDGARGHPGHAAGRRDGVRAQGADLAAVQLGPVVQRQSVGRRAGLHRARRPVHGPRLAALARLESALAVHDAPRPPVHRPRRRAAVPAGWVRVAVLRGLVRGDRAVAGLRRLVGRFARLAAAAADPAGALRRRAHARAERRAAPRLVGAARRALRRGERLLPRLGRHRRRRPT